MARLIIKYLNNKTNKIRWQVIENFNSTTNTNLYKKPDEQVLLWKVK